MYTILSKLNKIPKNRIALQTNVQKYSYDDLLDIAKKNKQALDFLLNKAVVINGISRLEFALLLILLDGVASKILFLPSDIDSGLYKQFYNEVNVQYEVAMSKGVLTYKHISSDVQNTGKPTQWIIPTSGTTDIPKLISHTFESLTKSTKFDINIGENFRWGLVFDIYRFSGIQVFLQSILSGSKLIITELDQDMSELLNTLIAANCNALSATPSFWRKVLMSKTSERLKLSRITLGGEIADQSILNALSTKFPNAKISHIYASTEVGVGFSVTDKKAGFPISCIEEGLDDLKMKIDSDGLLWISPKIKKQKYVNNSDMYDTDGYVNTGDVVEYKGERVMFKGRNSGAINVGGNKVQPEEIENILTSCPLVDAAYVYAKNNSMMGSLVCADLVLSEIIDKKEAKKAILRYCRENLESFKVPALIKFVNELETTQSGKLKRN